MVQFVSFYSIAMGAALILTRMVQYLTHQLQPESTTLQQAFTLGAEGLTGLCLILAGLGAITHRRWAAPVQLVALGMLLFCAVFSWGSFSLSGERADSIFFAASAVITLVFTVYSVRKSVRSSGSLPPNQNQVDAAGDPERPDNISSL